MVRVTTIWDKIEELINEEKVITQKKVFRIAGDESYARTTNVVFSNLTYSSRNTQGYILTAKVDVLRDYGDSTITIHDGDTVISVLNWSSTDSAKTITLPRLAWNVQHKLWISYDGNSQCLKSKSQVLEYSQPNPDLVDTTLSNNSAKVNYSADEEVTVSVKLAKTGGNASVGNREIRIFVDDVNYGTVTTNSSGVASVNVGYLSNGVKTVSAYFDGEDTLGDSSIVYNLYVGYILSIVEYPRVFINGVNNTVKVSVKDYAYNPINHIRVHFILGTPVYTDANGIATFTVTQMNNGVDYYAYLVDAPHYTSNIIKAYSTDVMSIDISARDSYTGLNRSNPITVILNGTNIQSNIAVTLQAKVNGSNIDSDINGTYYTDSNGQVTVDYVGGGNGLVSVTATCGDVSEDVTFSDVDMYISRPTISINPNWTVGGQEPIKLNNGFKIMPNQTIYGQGASTALIFDQATYFTSDIDGYLEFDVVDIQSNTFSIASGCYGVNGRVEGKSIPNLKKGSIIHISKVTDENGVTMTIRHKYKDSSGMHNDVIKSFDCGEGHFMLWITSSEFASYITINNIMLRRD